MITLEYIKSDPSRYQALREWYVEKVMCHYEPDWDYYTEYASERLKRAGFSLDLQSVEIDTSCRQGSGASFAASWAPYEAVSSRREMTTDKWQQVIDDMNKEHSLFTDYTLLYVAEAAGIGFILDVNKSQSRYAHSGCMNADPDPDDLWYGDEDERSFRDFSHLRDTVSLGTENLDPPVLRLYEGMDTLQLCEICLPMLDDLAEDALSYCVDVSDDLHEMARADVEYYYSEEAFEEWVTETLSYDANTVEAALVAVSLK